MSNAQETVLRTGLKFKHSVSTSDGIYIPMFIANGGLSGTYDYDGDVYTIITTGSPFADYVDGHIDILNLSGVTESGDKFNVDVRDANTLTFVDDLNGGSGSAAVTFDFSEVVDEITDANAGNATKSGGAIFWDYLVRRNTETHLKAGTLICTWKDALISLDQTQEEHVGTVNVTFTAKLVELQTKVRLYATATDSSYEIKLVRRLML